MSLVPPNLDDRDFQSLVDDAKRLVQQRCPEWTDHNVSDPGVTLIEAFAQMVDQLVYRLNRVPDRHYLAFLDLLGVRPFPPTASRGTVTFWLSAPQRAPVVVRAETEVATARTDTDDAVVLGTTEELTIVPCSLGHLATADASGGATDRTAELRRGQQVPCFSRVPQLDEALLIGLSAAVPSCAVLLRFTSPVGGAGIDPRDPPLVWEAWNGTSWSPCAVDRDETGGFNKAGDVVLHVPASHTASLVAKARAGWLRCRVVQGTTAYTSSPVVASVEVMTIGGTVDVVHAEAVRGEVLGVSDGAAGQRFTLARGPVVPWEEASVLEVVDADGAVTPYTAQRDFARSGPQDTHYRLERSAGVVELGPVVRLADGSTRQHGAVPPKGATLRLTAYRVGGGRRGNIARGMIRVLKTSVPYVARVENRHPAVGGVDGETLEEVRLRGPLELRAGGRAVTTDDFEELAREVAPDAARVRCVPAGTDPDQAGGIRLLVVPRVASDELGRVTYDDLARPPEELLRRVADHLDGRRLVGTRLVVEPPVYQGVTVVAWLSAAPGATSEEVRDAALTLLYGYLSPLAGGPELTGWPFGRSVQSFDLSGLLARAPGVRSVDELILFPADLRSGERGQPVPRIDLPEHGLVHSYQHQVRVR